MLQYVMLATDGSAAAERAADFAAALAARYGVLVTMISQYLPEQKDSRQMALRIIP
jgi:hypothetical protein